MNAYIHIYIYISKYIQVYPNISNYIQIYPNISKYIHIYIYIYMLCIYIYTRKYVYMHVYGSTYIYIYTYICIYIYIHIHSVSIIQKIHNIHNIYIHIYIYWYVSVYTSTFFFWADPLPPRCRKTFLEVVPSSSWCPAVRRSKKLHGAGWLPGGCSWDGAGKVEWVQRVGYRRAVPVRSGYISTVKRCCIMLYLNSWGFRTYLYTPICNLNCTPKVAMETHGCFPCTGSTFMIMNLVAFFCHRFHIYGFNQSTLGF